MSGKPASVGAVRAGAPRVLVYVEPRQLEPGAAPPPALHPHPPRALYLPDNLQHQLALPRNTVYRHNDHRNLPNTVFYKPVNDIDNKVNVYGSTENITHRTEFYPVSQQYVKETGLKIEDCRTDRGSGANVKPESVDKIGAEFSSVETFQGRVPVESVELATNQARCSGGDSMPVQQIVSHGQNQYSESVTVHSADASSGERELVGKSYVNYQFLEQSVSHQSIVNQSISILNQQVGVSRGVVSEGDSATPPQLVRTADGVVLAVVPSPVGAQSTDTADNSRTAPSDPPQTITVPLGWRRIVTGTSVIYLSPSGTALSALPQLREYLQTTGTCKCGLPCPLRPETAFSFDSKVVSKPYQVASGAELTKLCNHKRKLLATLQARGQSPATPPPQNTEQKKVMGTEVAVLKKKMKKRPGFPANVSVSQLMVQRERPLAEFKDTDPSRDVPPAMVQPRASGGPALPTCAGAQHAAQHNAPPADSDPKQDSHVQRGSHYITVNNGWITQQNSEAQKSNQSQSVPLHNAQPSVGVPVRGVNGQIIGVNTCYKYNYRGPLPEQEHKDHRKDTPVQQNLQSGKQIENSKEEDSQIFCGLNQPLTPEVMQKINEQQQIFIQQNQKQIEMAMKGYRNQLTDSPNQSKLQGQSQFASQGQLVIQNGTVVKTNPAKTPPWQVKRNDSSCSNTMTSPNPKIQKLENADYEESNATMSEDSSSSFSSFSSNEQGVGQGMCSRVPPLPQHYNMLGQQWPAIETNKKKGKSNKGGKKKNSPTESKVITFGGNGMRLVQDPKGSNPDEMGSNIVPSFMDDPTGYLAQQTVLLNNTISRQVGMTSTYEGSQFDGSNSSNYIQHQRPMSKPGDLPNVYRNNMANSSPSPNTTPDSSVLSDKGGDNIPQCCKGCNISSKGGSPEYVENQMRLKYMKQNMYKMELEGNPSTSSPKHGFDDSPVTSSTFIERNQAGNGNCSPIQAGTVSTSNVSHTETLQPPEPSPTFSNSSRSTDTPHSSGSNNSQMQPNSSYLSPAYMTQQNSCRDNFNSNPSTPGSSQIYQYNSPGPPNTQSITGTQMMHFISNHNVNKNLMEVDNISMVGVKPGMKGQEMYRVEPRRRIENSMPGYCPPPHMGGGPAHSLIQACYIQTFVTTMASGFSVTRDTVTSVLAGKANTATTSINASQANFVRPPPPPSVNLATTYAIPNNQPDPFLNSVNLPTSYPLHIAGTTAQNMISKSPLEMVQNVIGSLPSKSEPSIAQAASYQQMGKRATPGQILISSTGQIIVSSNQMLPPPPKVTTTVASGHGSSATSVSSAVAQPAAAVQQMVNQSTVVVNTLPAPFVIHDGQVVQQNTVLPQLVGGIVPGQSPNETSRQIDIKNHQSYMQGVAMVSPESLKKRSKKKKNQTANITNVLQITAPQQNASNIMVHSSPQHNTSPQFSPRGFQLSPNNNISPTPMLQALTIVPGKSGAPAHIVMNGQGNTNNFGSQQIIANTSPSQQINLLQPVNLINNAGGVMSNFPAFQQFIVPNLGGMVMTADGTAIIQDGSTGMPMQLQLQTVNGQNVLTPVQNQGVFAAGANGGVVLRAQNQQGKIIQSQHSPGAQFLSPNGQMMMNGPNFNGQLSPLLANLSPTNVTFNGQVRSGNVQTQEYIQTNQMGPALVLPLSPKRPPLAAGRANSTFVHNTTIVQQQTTLVSNSHGGPAAARRSPAAALAHKHRPAEGEELAHALGAAAELAHVRHSVSTQALGAAAELAHVRHSVSTQALGAAAELAHVRHSVSTQTRAGRGKSPSRAVSASSPPDTTTHSPLGALEPEPRLYAAATTPTYAAAATPTYAAAATPTYADTTTTSPEPADANSSAMVQCVSSSEQDMAESREHAWPAPRTDFNVDSDGQNMMSNMPMMRQRSHNPVESSEIHYNHAIGAVQSHQHVMPIATNYYERTQSFKRKNDFGDGSTYRSDKIMRTNTYNMVHMPKDNEYDLGMTPDKSQARHYQPSGSNSDASSLPKVFDRHSLGSSDDAKSPDETDAKTKEPGEKPARKLEVGDLVWGPVKGYPSWPGELRGRGEGGCWLVRWFGADKPPALVQRCKLLTLSEGLEAHHAARTKHRKSRKLNTLLENAIQEAMSELDKKSEPARDAAAAAEGASAVGADAAPITETPKRSKKHDKVKTKEKHHKKTPVKIAPNPNKTGDGARLRSSR